MSKNSRRFRLTRASKILIFALIIGLIAGGVTYGVKTGSVKTKSDDSNNNKVEESVAVAKDTDTNGNDPLTGENGNLMNTVKMDDAEINLSLDEWIGWKSIIDANGGLSTEKGSIYDELGIAVNISIINDATQSSNALISGSLDAAGYTINRTAFLSKKFKDANVKVIMPFITNFSNGGDGIISKTSINTINDLKTAKIGVPQFSEAHSLVVWFVNQSDLSEEEKRKTINNLIFFETPDEAAKAFFAGQIDVAATWEPYLTQAQNMTDAHILFSTASSSSLIMDGILFNVEFAKENPDVVSKFIDGALQASNQYDVNMDTIKNVMPMFATASDQDIKDNCAAARLTTYADNINLFGGTAKTIYSDMCGVWESIGESVDKELVNTLYDDAYITKLANKYSTTELTKPDKEPVVTEDNDDTIEETIALLQKSASVNFIISTAKFSDSAEATKTLDEFIEIAKVLDGAIIEIAGNTDPNPSSDPTDELNKKLSLERAETVKQYFILNGISANRIYVVGNGSSNPVAPNDTDKNRAKNRRTDISFKMIE